MRAFVRYDHYCGTVLAETTQSQINEAIKKTQKKPGKVVIIAHMHVWARREAQKALLKKEMIPSLERTQNTCAVTSRCSF